MAAHHLMLSVHTARRRYVVRREDVAALYALSTDQSAGVPRAVIYRDLGALLDPVDQLAEGRCHVLQVDLRRRCVGLLVERADELSLLAHEEIRPLAGFMARSLIHPWISGAIIDDDSPVLVLDLARIARDVALGAV